MKKLACFSLLSLLCTLTVFSQTLLPGFYVTNGTVSAIAQHGNTVYIGGSFNYVGPNAPNGASLDIITGAPNLAFGIPNGNVYAVAPDGNGGWYIGGYFTQVGTQTRNYMARINADGSLNAWNPNANNGVISIVVNGGIVYAGGPFTCLLYTS